VWCGGDGASWSVGGAGSASFAMATGGGRQPAPPPLRRAAPLRAVGSKIWRTSPTTARRPKFLAHLLQTYLLLSTSTINDNLCNSVYQLARHILHCRAIDGPSNHPIQITR
jgi:hypothetical protein